MKAAELVDRLDGVKPTGPGRWIARCPAHEDRSPSLSVRELDDGRVLLHCFTGCGAIDVLEALGLDWGALFREEVNGRELRASHSSVPARDRLMLIDHEVTVAALIVADVLRARAVDAAQWTRLAEACARIGRARDHGRA